MAYTTKETFESNDSYPVAYLNTGNLISYEDGSGPRTYAEDLALISNSEGYGGAIRQLNGKIEASETEAYDVAIWVGLKADALTKENDEIEIDDIVEKVAIGCPPYIRPFIHFDLDAMIAKERGE